MTDGIRWQTILHEPFTCPPMVCAHAVRLGFPQVRLENFGKEVVISICLALIIQRDDEQVAPLQNF